MEFLSCRIVSVIRWSDLFPDISIALKLCCNDSRSLDNSADVSCTFESFLVYNCRQQKCITIGVKRRSSDGKRMYAYLSHGCRSDNEEQLLELCTDVTDPLERICRYA